MSLAVLIVIVSGVCFVLGLPPVRRQTRSFVTPRLIWLGHPDEPHSSKSRTTSSETGDDWQANTNPDSISSGSRA
jgi:hypothetical protein